MDLKKFAFLGFGKPKEQFPIRSFNDFPVPIPREVMNQWEREAKSRNLDDYAKANNFFAEKFNPWLETPAGKAWNKKQADVFNRQKGKTAMDLKKFAKLKVKELKNATPQSEPLNPKEDAKPVASVSNVPGMTANPPKRVVAGCAYGTDKAPSP